MAVELITPAVAAEMLANSNGNRRLKEGRIQAYMRDMRSGGWRDDNPQSVISLTKDGHVLDGQHRLHAVVRSGVTIKSRVERDVDPTVMEVLDSGAPRSFSDILSIRGEKSAAQLSSAVSWCWRYERAEVARHGGNLIPTHHELVAWLEKNPNIRESVQPGRNFSQQTRIPASSVIGFHYMAREAGHGDLPDRFFEEVLSGANLEEGSATLALRNWTVNMLTKRDKPDRTVYAAILIKAFNYWVEGREVVQLRWAAKGPHREDFPLIVEAT